MTPLEIISKLKSLKTKKGKEKILADLDPNHEFWLGAYHGLTTFTEFKTGFAIQNPVSFGDGVPTGVFEKIVDAVETRKLTEENLVVALSKFSQTCTKEEWESWYNPILSKRLILPITITQFNKYCPEHLRVDSFAVPDFVNVGETSTPTDFYMEPLYDSGDHRVFVFASTDDIRVFLDDGTEIKHNLPEELSNVAKKKIDVVFEAYMTNDLLVIRDVLLKNQFMDMKEKTGPLNIRLTVLSTINDAILEKHCPYNVCIADTYKCSLNDDEDQSIRETFNMIIQQGYSGVIVRPINHEYFQENSNIVIKPEKKSILTCTKLEKGKAGSKYEGAIEYVRGSGTMNRKRFEASVFQGLTFTEKELLLKNEENYIGRKFEVISCGLGPNNNLLFPIFTGWKE